MNALYGVTSLLPALLLLRFVFLASIALYMHRVMSVLVYTPNRPLVAGVT